MVLGKLGDRCFWQSCGRTAPRLVTRHHTPAACEVSGEGRARLSREVTRGLQEMEESRAMRRPANVCWRPGSRCPSWLLALHEGPVS